MLDKLSLKLLKRLYDNNLSEYQVNEILGITDTTRPDPRLSKLLSEKLITYRTIGIPDGEGGIEHVISRTFSILPQGMVVVENARKDFLHKLIDIVCKFLP